MHVIVNFTAMRQFDETYCPMSDGYRPGAQIERTLMFDLADDLAREPKIVAEMVFQVTNMGSPGTPLGDAVMHAIYDDILSGAVPRIRSLSVGDTVQVGETFLMCQSMGFDEPPAPVSPARAKALQILADVQPDFEYRREVFSAQFSALMWPYSEGWEKWSHGSRNGTAKAVGIKRAGGAFLSRMERDGLVRVRHTDTGQSRYSITSKGRQVLAFTKASA